MHQREVGQTQLHSCLDTVNIYYLRGGADKSLARPGRKQVTATKLEIYSTYSEGCPSNQVSAAAITSTSENNGDLSIVFSVQGTDGSPTWPDTENRAVD